MESLFIFWILLLLGSTFVFPQLIGVLLHFRLARRSRWLAFAFGFLVPAVLFFYLAPLFFIAGGGAQSNSSRCGLPGLAVALMMLAGTAAELIVSLPIQLYLFRRNNTESPADMKRVRRTTVI
jgi:NADH:ubiquinone oxidoreductase subunit K